MNSVLQMNSLMDMNVSLTINISWESNLFNLYWDIYFNTKDDFQNEDIDLSPSDLEYLAQNPKAGKICNKLSAV